MKPLNISSLALPQKRSVYPPGNVNTTRFPGGLIKTCRSDSQNCINPVNQIMLRKFSAFLCTTCIRQSVNHLWAFGWRLRLRNTGALTRLPSFCRWRSPLHRVICCWENPAGNRQREREQVNKWCVSNFVCLWLILKHIPDWVCALFLCRRPWRSELWQTERRPRPRSRARQKWSEGSSECLPRNEAANCRERQMSIKACMWICKKYLTHDRWVFAAPKTVI